MSLLDVNADALKTAAVNEPYRPQKPTAKASAWSLGNLGSQEVPDTVRVMAAPSRGVAAGGAETFGMMGDVLGAFGQAFALTAPATPMFGVDPVPEQTEAARRQVLDQGISYSSEAGDLFRGVARSYRPDALPASTAERLVFDLSRVLSKAVGSAVVLGPAGGAVATGVNEGMQVADDLRLEGVDEGTRTAVGAVQGLATGLGVALPVAGRTLAETVGLVALGGPVSFMGATAASREILKREDYTKLAEQFDPFDPVGLAVSTIVPAAFGGYALRGARIRQQAKAEAEFMAGDIPSQPTPLAQAVSEAYRFTPEDIAAARVVMQMEQRRASNPGDPESLPAMERHEAALSKDEDQIARGEPVQVADVAPGPRVPQIETPEFRAWFGESQVVAADGKPLVVYHGTGRPGFDSFDPATLGDMTGGADARAGFFFTDSAAVADEFTWFSGNKDGAIYPTFLSLRNPATITDMVLDGSNGTEAGRRIEAARAAGHDGVIFERSNFLGKTGRSFVAFEPTQVKSAIGNSGRFDPNSPSLTDPIADFADNITTGLKSMRAELDATRPGATPDAPVTPPGTDATTTRAAATADQATTAEGGGTATNANLPGARGGADEAGRVSDEAIVNPIDRNATREEKVRQLAALTKENKPLVKAFLKQLDEDLGTKSQDNVKADVAILTKATRPSILSEKPWHDVEHIRDSYRFKTVLDNIEQLPQAVERLLATGAEIVKPDVGKVLQPKLFGWRIAVFDLRLKNGQLIEYYLPLKELEAAKKNGGHQLFEEARNLDLNIPKQAAKYAEVAARSRAHYQAAFDAYLARTGQTETDIRASLDRAAASASGNKSYPSAKSPPLQSGAGDRQLPSSDRTAENPSGPNTNATPDPLSETNARTDISSTSGEIVRRLAVVQERFPDLTVQMDGMDAPMRMADFLAAVKREADDDIAGAPDLMDAATCALLNGV